jgi:phosphonate transport system substrate-binding protein
VRRADARRVGAMFALVLLAQLALTAGCGDDAGLVDEVGRGASARGSVVLRITAAPDSDARAQRTRFEVLAAVLEERLNIAAAFVPAKSEQEAVAMFRDGRVQLAWLDAAAGLAARRGIPGARVIAQGVEDREVHSYFIANRSLGLSRTADFPESLRGRSFAYGPSGSTAGWLMPESAVRQQTGEAPSEFFERVELARSEADTLERVDAGRAEAGALGQRSWESAGADQKANTLRIWQTPGYPSYSLMVGPELDDEFRDGFSDDLTAILLELQGDVCEQVFFRSDLVAASNDSFAPVEAALSALGPPR